VSARSLDDRLLLAARTRAHGPHATTSFAAARAYRGLLPAWSLYALAVAYALSRPYLGVHYPSDVLAGALLGTAVGQGGAPCR
jgi:membrane-associated phospholipid phosphatase